MLIKQTPGMTEHLRDQIRSLMIESSTMVTDQMLMLLLGMRDVGLVTQNFKVMPLVEDQQTMLEVIY